MYAVSLPLIGFASVWRNAARRLISHGIAPEQVVFHRAETADLFATAALPECQGPYPVRAPKEFLRLANSVLCHSDPEAPGLLYYALSRHQNTPGALRNPADRLTRSLHKYAKAVGRDIHKMHAFVRFRELGKDQGRSERRKFGAWFEPDHYCLEAGTPFFARRFGDMDWMIATPQGVASWDGVAISYHDPVPKPDLPEDASEALWGTYFQSIFNPARIHLQAMRSEMPLKYWKNLPETRLIPGMLAEAEERVARMRAALPSEPPTYARRILERYEEENIPVIETEE